MITHKLRFITATSCALLVLAVSSSRADTLAQFDWTNLSSNQFASQVNPAGATTSAFDSSSSPIFSGDAANAWNSTNQWGGTQTLGSFTVTADAPGTLNLDTLTYALGWWQTANTHTFLPTSVEVVSNGIDPPITLAGVVAEEFNAPPPPGLPNSGAGPGFTQGSVDLSAFQGLDSATITITAAHPGGLPGAEFLAILSSQSSGQLSPMGRNVEQAGTWSDLILTGSVNAPTVIPEPATGLVAFLGMAGVVLRRRRSA